MTARLSVVIVSYHSQTDLARCLPSIARQRGVGSVEVIVVDNAPSDGTAAWLAREHPSVHVIANSTNTGYAGGSNLGLRHASGEHVLLLNPDTELHEGALRTLLQAAHAHPEALLTPKLLQPDGSVNACGNELHVTGITSCRGLGDPAVAFTGTHPVPLLSGAAILARRELLAALGGFDETFFMYLEDTELSLRARARGQTLLCAADATVTHHYALAMTPAKFYYLERNRWLTLLKHFERSTLWRLAPALVLTELATWAFALSRGPAYMSARLRASTWLWRERRAWRRARAEAQATRRLGDATLLAGATSALPFEQLVTNAPTARWLKQLTDPLYRLLTPRFRSPTSAAVTSAARSDGATDVR